MIVVYRTAQSGIFILMLVGLLHSVTAYIEMQVKPYPALIYQHAPPGTAVLNIIAYDNDTGDALRSVSITNGNDGEYFDVTQQVRLPREWVLSVKKDIDKPIGYVYDFNVYAYGTARDRNVKINVTEKNLYSPSFEKESYDFLSLRNAWQNDLTLIGTVKAIDMDKQAYNSEFHYHILDPAANKYFHVDLITGDIEVIRNLPGDVSNITFNVTAIDGGSPQALNSTMVTVRITDLPPPDIFCVAVEDTVARICWKDPTNGSYVMKYELLFQLDGQNTTTIPVHVNGVRDETCSIVRGAQLNRNYTFTVRVFNGLEWSPESLQRKVIVTRKGLYGDCPVFSNCSVWEPCMNKGECLVNDDLSYTCNCTKGWGGENCTGHDLCPTNPCNKGSCKYKGDNQVTCDCPPDTYGTHCEKLSPCVNHPCGTGECKQDIDDYICHCPDGSQRKNCFNTSCPADNGFYDRTGYYDWPETRSGDTAKVKCNYGSSDPYLINLYRQYAQRECAGRPNGRSFWRPPDTSQCKELKAADVSKSLKDLDNWTKDASGLGADEISNITATLEDLFFFSFTDPDIAKTLTAVVGNLLDANETVLIESNSKDHSSDRLLWLLDEYASNVETEKSISIETENINLQVVNVTEPTKEIRYEPTMESGDKTVSSGISMKLPSEVLTSSEEDFPRLQLMAFRSSSFFIPSDHVPDQEIVMKQWVVTAVVQGHHVTNLTDPVEIVIRNIKENQNHTCVYWNTNNNTWSSAGVKTADRGKNFTRCLSYHLTSFAVVLDPSPTYLIPETHNQVLTFIAYIGSGISIVGLLMTIITYAIFRCLNREKSGKILLNLCVSMLLMNVTFILGSESSLSISGDSMCKIVAVLLHYFLLTTLMWMLIEAINMYQALIKVFTKYSGYFILKRCLAAWGIPAVIVTIVLAIDDDNYKTSTELCFLSHGNPLAFYIGLLGPACLILLINTIIFVLVSRVILRPRFHGNVNPSDSLNPAQIRGAFTVMTLLGITWVFGPFAINEAKLVINYVFTILNSLQGFLIFIFRCCFNPEVRMAWILLIKTGTFKRRKGPIKAFISDTNSSKAESRANGSVAETLKSNVFNSNSTGSQPNGVSNGVGNGVSNGVNGVSHDKMTNGHAQNGQSQASKDLQTYFEELHKYKNKDQYLNGRNSDQLIHGFGEGDRIMNGNLRIHSAPDISNGSPYRNSNAFRNGTFRADQTYQGNGGPYRTDEPAGVTMIYTGTTNGPRRLSRYDIDSDEFTKL